MDLVPFSNKLHILSFLNKVSTFLFYEFQNSFSQTNEEQK